MTNQKMHKNLLVTALFLTFLSVFLYTCAHISEQEINKNNQTTEAQPSFVINSKTPLPIEETKTETPVKVSTVVKKKIELEPELKINAELATLKDGFKPSKHGKPLGYQYAKAGALIDLSKKKVLWAKNIDKELPLASLTKVLTTLAVLEKCKDEKHNLKQKAKISSTARTTEHSKFLRLYKYPEVTLNDLCQTAIVKSANDSCTLIKEHFDTTDGQFIAYMNGYAKKIGLTKSKFYNPHGLPGAYSKPAIPDNTSTVRDLITLTQKAAQTPQMIKWANVQSVSYPGVKTKTFTLGNTNPMIEVAGVNGLKTGFTNNAGWCIIYTYKRGNKHFAAIILGCASKTQRNTLARNLLSWAKKH